MSTYFGYLYSVGRFITIRKAAEISFVILQ